MPPPPFATFFLVVTTFLFALIYVKVPLSDSDDNGRIVKTFAASSKPPSDLSGWDFLAELPEVRTFEENKAAMTTVQKGDIAVRWGYNTAPIVIKKYNLLFFTVPKVACSVFKKLFRRMEGKSDWMSPEGSHTIHDPRSNGLNYLFQYSSRDAEEMMTSSNWTRAMFLRDPKDRLLSAYLEKGLHNPFIREHCCDEIKNAKEKALCTKQVSSFAGFVERAKTCKNEHWRPYATRLDKKHWKYVTFFGRFDKLAEDTERLLRAVGSDAWDLYGKTGWGHQGNGSIFYSPAANHMTNATSKYEKYYTPELEKEVEEMYAADYRILNYTKSLGKR